jgi:hypothetical protein
VRAHHYYKWPEFTVNWDDDIFIRDWLCNDGTSIKDVMVVLCLLRSGCKMLVVNTFYIGKEK